VDLASKLFKGDRAVWIIFMLLCLISLVEVFSATSTLAYKNANHWAPIVRHATFLLGGFVIILLIHNFHYRFFSVLIFLLPVSIVLLIATPWIGISANDAHRWLEIFGIQFQPSEFAKLSLIVFIAFMMSRRSRFTEKQIYYSILITAGITCFIIFWENVSTAIMLFVISFLMMFIGQLPFWKLFRLGAGLVLGGCLLLFAIYNAPDDMLEKAPGRLTTVKARLERYINPTEDVVDKNGNMLITDENYQEVHAKIAIARGGILGKMPGHGQQRDFLPQAYSDFIYAIIIEELGIIIGGFGVLLLYIMLLVRGGIIAWKCEKPFAKYLVLGCTLVIVVQAFFNMAVAVDLFPVTGQPLPLVSRGGTSILISCIYIGVILSVSRFGAGMGNEEELAVENTAEENALDEKEMETVLASVEVETIEEANL
jgi:cell division protein FtsW